MKNKRLFSKDKRLFEWESDSFLSSPPRRQFLLPFFGGGTIRHRNTLLLRKGKAVKNVMNGFFVFLLFYPLQSGNARPENHSHCSALWTRCPISVFHLMQRCPLYWFHSLKSAVFWILSFFSLPSVSYSGRILFSYSCFLCISCTKRKKGIEFLYILIYNYKYTY